MELRCCVSSRVPSGSPHTTLPPHPRPADASPSTPPLFAPPRPPRHAGKTQLPSSQQGWARQAFRCTYKHAFLKKKKKIEVHILWLIFQYVTEFIMHWSSMSLLGLSVKHPPQKEKKMHLMLLLNRLLLMWINVWDQTVNIQCSCDPFAW